MTDVERLYQLLPSIYRQQDITAGEPLRALLAVIERELRTIESDIEATYDNWFVQTCDVWVLPYLADLVGIRAMGQQRYIFGTQRRQVANMIAYRRRKGTLSVLEHVLRDVTGWHVRAVELYQQIAAAPHLAGPGRATPATVDLRDALALAHSGGPFNRHGHSVDVRLVDPAAAGALLADSWRPGRYNLGNLALFVWRLRSYTVRDSQPYPLPDSGEAAVPRYTLHPTGRPMRLFNRPQVVGDVAARLEEEHLPLPLTRAELAADLEDYAMGNAGKRPEDRATSSRFYGPDRGLHIAVLPGAGDAPQPLPPLAVACADLGALPESALAALRDQGKCAVIDPATGQVALLIEKERAAAGVLVTYSYGFSAEIGGGPYHRRTPQGVPAEARLITVARGTTTPTLRAALACWDEYCACCDERGVEPRGIIRLLDNARHGDDGAGDLMVALPLGADLTIAADNGVRPAIGPGRRLVVRYDRPEKSGQPALSIRSLKTAPDDASIGGDVRSRHLRIDGLLIDGGLRVEAKAPYESGAGHARISIEHCTIIPGGVELDLPPTRARVTLLTIASSIVGPLRAPSELSGIIASDSIIDGAPEQPTKAPALMGLAGSAGAPLTIERVTIFGDVLAQDLTAHDCIIAGAAHDRGDPTLGRVYHTYIAANSAGAAPLFAATRYGQPGYAQLRPDCPAAIRRGAADGSELGVFYSLHHAQAEENLAPILDEYLPIGLEAGVFFIT
jgi:hypothetical protein